MVGVFFGGRGEAGGPRMRLRAAAGCMLEALCGFCSCFFFFYVNFLLVFACYS